MQHACISSQSCLPPFLPNVFLTGVSATNLEHYSVTLQSSSLYIATINITSESLYGEWIISLAVGSYDVTIHAISDLSFTVDLLAFDPTSTYGFSTVVGKPLNGK